MNAADLELLRPLWIPSSFVADENCTESIKSWLIDGNYYVNNSPPDLSLFSQSIDDVRKCLSFDAFRFAAHSAQTVFEIERGAAYSRFTAWRVIQTYYAAYFSAHAILRFFGKSFSHLENGHVNFLSKRCSTEVGYNPRLPSSYYEIAFDNKSQNLIFTKQDESHKDLWKCFYKLVQDISNGVISSTASKERRENLSRHFSDLGEALTLRGRYPSGNWLSVMRNEVNYKSSHGAWYPFSKNNPNFADIMNKVGNWRVGANQITSTADLRNDLERFALSSFVIVDIALSLSYDYQRMGNKAGRRSSHFSRLIMHSAAAA